MSKQTLHEQILENIPDGITIQDTDFNVIYQNAAMKQAFGDQIGVKCYAAYEKRTQICEKCGVQKAFETGKFTVVHRTAVTQDNEVSHWENSCFPLFDDAGTIIAGGEVCRNVTDRNVLAQEVRERNSELGALNDQLRVKQTELEAQTRKLEDAYQELQRTHTQLLQKEKLASIGQLASGIAHEINTPIQFVGNNIDFLRESFEELIVNMHQCQEQMDPANPDVTEFSKLRDHITSMFEALDFEYLKTEIPLALDQAADGTRRVAQIVLAMKNFASVGEKALGPVELEPLVRSTVEITRNVWEEVADISVEFSHPGLIVKGLQGDIGQVLLNLIINAADAISDKSPAEQGKIRILTRINENWGELLVEDSGCGIDSSLIMRIFEPFFTTKDVGKGSGQGLAIAYNIITDTHKGELLVESEPGKGATFIVRLPLYESWVDPER